MISWGSWPWMSPETYEFMGFGDTSGGPKPYKFIGFGWFLKTSLSHRPVDVPYWRLYVS